MVEEQIVARGVKDPATIAAMQKVPRHLFVPPALAAAAYADRPLGIGNSQTISQPYIVAFMTELLGLEHGDKVLEIGTGSGYQAAVLLEITPEVYTIEIVEPLHQQAKKVLTSLGMAPERIRLGDGYAGWKEQAPFNAIIVTAAPEQVPQELVRQLKPGGRLVVPVGPQGLGQQLQVITKQEDGSTTSRDVLPVRFVPMTGQGK
jgi:protein-L-isoaspartate(D-aspartate) O-methyltransferase